MDHSCRPRCWDRAGCTRSRRYRRIWFWNRPADAGLLRAATLHRAGSSRPVPRRAAAEYDAAADHWLITQLGSAGSAPYSECIAVSTSNDPRGSYYLYTYNFGTSLNDYPKFGVWPTASNSAYLATYNMFANAQTFTGAQLCAYDRAAMLAGASQP